MTRLIFVENMLPGPKTELIFTDDIDQIYRNLSSSCMAILIITDRIDIGV